MPTSGISRGECIIFCLFGIVHMYIVNPEENLWGGSFCSSESVTMIHHACLEKKQDAADTNHRGRYRASPINPGTPSFRGLPGSGPLNPFFALRTFPQSLSCQYSPFPPSHRPSLHPYYASNPSAPPHDFSTRALKYASRSNFGSIGSWSTMRLSVYGYSVRSEYRGAAAKDSSPAADSRFVVRTGTVLFWRVLRLGVFGLGLLY